MGGGILRKWLGPAAAAPPQVTAALEELARLAQERPALAGPAAVLSDVLPALHAEPVREVPPPLPDEQVAAKLAGGVPLLRGETVSLESTSCRRRWLAVCRAVQRQHGNEAPRALAGACRRGRLDPQELLTAVLAGRAEAVHARAEELGLDPSLTATVLRLTLFPVLSHVHSALHPSLKGQRWPHGHCPTCGSWPLLAEFRGLEQQRRLRCGWCSADWAFPRLRCPFCGSGDHHMLGYFHAEEQENRCRAVTCDACRGYVKTVSTLQALDGPQLLIADLTTMHLDLAAAERGYYVAE